MQHGKLQGEKDFGNRHVKVDVPVIYFEEDGVHFAYIPSFDLTGYGKTEADCLDSLGVVLDEFLRYTLAKNTLVLELRRLGWKIKSKKKPMKGPELSDMINSNEQLKDIVNHKQYTTSRYPVNMPAFA